MPSNRTNDLKEKMLIALEIHDGIITPAAKDVGINRETHYAWLKADLHYKARVDEINEGAIDLGEELLRTRMKERSDACIIFYLKCKAKDRGYVERQEITGKDGESVVPITGYRIEQPKPNN